MDSKFLTFPVLFVILLLSGCQGDSESHQSCANCVWGESSESLAVTSYGGVTGSVSKTEFAHTSITAEIESRLEKLKTVPSDLYYNHGCIFDDFKSTLTVVDRSGREVSYYGNKSGCGPLDEKLNYVDYYEMENILRLLGGASLQSVWSDNSERFEILKGESSNDLESVVDFTRDTLPEALQRRLPSLSLTIDDKTTCLTGYSGYVVRVTDNTGLTREYTDQGMASCNADLDKIEYIPYFDIVDLMGMADLNVTDFQREL